MLLFAAALLALNCGGLWNDGTAREPLSFRAVKITLKRTETGDFPRGLRMYLLLPNQKINVARDSKIVLKIFNVKKTILKTEMSVKSRSKLEIISSVQNRLTFLTAERRQCRSQR